MEVFAYDATMGDWRTHDGLDIAAELGTPVAACAKGTVTDVSTDDMMGVTVTVDHGKGMESVYSNLAESVNVQPGTEVEAGTVIGTVGTTAVSESADASHLHFSMREYGVAIDPLNYRTDLLKKSPPVFPIGETVVFLRQLEEKNGGHLEENTEDST